MSDKDLPALLGRLAEIGRLLRTQDNRITSHPMFLVQERREILPDGRSDAVALWEFSDACFTEASAEAIIARHGHNLDSPRVYVASGFRNPEWQLIREFLLALSEPGVLESLNGGEAHEVTPKAPPAAATSGGTAWEPSPHDLDAELRQGRW